MKQEISSKCWVPLNSAAIRGPKLKYPQCPVEVYGADRE